MTLIESAMKAVMECKNLTVLTQRVVAITYDLRFTAVAGGMLTGPKAESGNLFYFNNWPETWLEVYQRSGILELDPIVRWAMASGAPITWSALASQLDPADPGRELFILAAEHGYTEGFAVPVRTLAGHLGLVSVAGDRGTLSTEEQIFLQVVGAAAINRAETLAEKPAVARPVAALTERERECVSLLVRGLTEQAIADQLGIAPVTARFHLDNAKLKMRASSRSHLASLAAGLTQNRR